MKIQCLVFMLIPFISMATNPGKVNFYTGSLNNAKEIAAQEGKLYFVEFTASWCMPCRWMDETTFTDARLIKYIEGNYVPVKVDIDDFDGYAYKQMYNIRMLPSILVFNSKGKLLAKYEESLPPTKLLNILKSHDKPGNRVRTVKTYQPTNSKPTPVSYSTTSSKISRPALKPVRKQKSNTQSLVVSKPKTKPVSKPKTSPKPPRIAEGEGLFRFKVTHQASQGFSVQTGAYREYGNVLREGAKLQELLDQPMIVHIAKINGSTVYKILFGAFNTREEAIRYRDLIKGKGVNGIIKDMSTMK